MRRKQLRGIGILQIDKKPPPSLSDKSGIKQSCDLFTNLVTTVARGRADESCNVGGSAGEVFHHPLNRTLGDPLHCPAPSCMNSRDDPSLAIEEHKGNTVRNTDPKKHPPSIRNERVTVRIQSGFMYRPDRCAVHLHRKGKLIRPDAQSTEEEFLVGPHIRLLISHLERKIHPERFWTDTACPGAHPKQYSIFLLETLSLQNDKIVHGGVNHQLECG